MSSDTELRRAKLLNLLGPLDIRQRYSVHEASAYLRQSYVRTYEQIKAGELPVIKDGRRTYIPGSAIAARSALPEATAA